MNAFRRSIFTAVAVACATIATPSLANHDANQHVGEAIGPILGTFSAGSGTFSGTQIANRLMPYTFYGTAGQSITASTVGSDYDTGLSLLYKLNGTNVFSTDVIGTDLAVLLSQDDTAFGTANEQFSFTLANTGYYALTVGGFGGDTGTYSLSLTGATATAAVPEPATWAMMLMGFGIVGFGLRSRRNVTTRLAFH